MDSSLSLCRQPSVELFNEVSLTLWTIYWINGDMFWEGVRWHRWAPEWVELFGPLSRWTAIEKRDCHSEIEWTDWWLRNGLFVFAFTKDICQFMWFREGQSSAGLNICGALRQNETFYEKFHSRGPLRSRCWNLFTPTAIFLEICDSKTATKGLPTHLPTIGLNGCRQFDDKSSVIASWQPYEAANVTPLCDEEEEAELQAMHRCW